MIRNRPYKAAGFRDTVSDYTGKLNSHEEYLQILKLLENKCKYIEYVLVDEDDTKFIETFKDSVISMQPQNKWWGTKSSRKSKVYKLKSSPQIFKYLKQFETFCKYTISETGDIAEDTDFGINDIAFFDDAQTPLLFTTTHEGYIMVRADLL